MGSDWRAGGWPAGQLAGWPLARWWADGQMTSVDLVVVVEIRMIGFEMIKLYLQTLIKNRLEIEKILEE